MDGHHSGHIGEPVGVAHGGLGGPGDDDDGGGFLGLDQFDLDRIGSVDLA
jgi:hypothetical protein